MKTVDVIKELSEWDRQGRYLFAKRDLAKIFAPASENNFNQMLRRLVEKEVLVRVAQGIYLNPQSSHVGSNTIGDIAMALRPGEYVFESMESALSQWGRISQIPVDRITLVTTGRKGTYKTPYGTIEFTHTKSSANEILDNTISRPNHSLPIATETYAIVNLRRSGRNLNMLTEGD